MCMCEYVRVCISPRNNSAIFANSVFVMASQNTVTINNEKQKRRCRKPQFDFPDFFTKILLFVLFQVYKRKLKINLQ